MQSDEEGAPWRVADIANQPVAAFSPAVGEVVATYRLGIAREAVRQIGGLMAHGFGRRPVGDALQRKSLQQFRQNGRAGGVGRHEHAQLPGDDLVEQAVGAEPIAHLVGKTGQLDAVGRP